MTINIENELGKPIFPNGNQLVPSIECPTGESIELGLGGRKLNVTDHGSNNQGEKENWGGTIVLSSDTDRGLYASIRGHIQTDVYQNENGVGGYVNVSILKNSTVTMMIHPETDPLMVLKVTHKE